MNESSEHAPPQGLLRTLFQPVDIASLVVFRIAFGLLLAQEWWKYLSTGKVQSMWIQPVFLFTYEGFDWVRPWPGDGMYWHFIALIALCLMIALGLFYRAACVLFAIAWAYVWLLDKGQENNHYYLISLLGFLMAFVPAHRAYSLDSLLFPKIRSQFAPTWGLWLIRFQLAVPYVFGGIAKINADWLLTGEPMRKFIHDTRFFFFRKIVEQNDFDLTEAVVYFMSWSGMLLDLFIVPALLYRRTRIFALVVVTLFHMLNSKLFNIGVFPPLMFAATLVFFAPSWPRRLGTWLTFIDERPPQPNELDAGKLPFRITAARKIGLGCFAIFAAIQLLVPLRHFLYPGNVSWTMEGNRFAWRMRLVTAVARGQLHATRPDTQETWELDPLDHLTFKQYSMLFNSPDMIRQFSHYLADELAAQGQPDVQIRATVSKSVNLRRQQLFIDANQDLASTEFSFWPAEWIIPLEVSRTDRIGELDDLQLLFEKSAIEITTLGRLASQLGSPGAAVGQFELAVEKDPTSAKAHAYLGRAHLLTQQFNTAVGPLKKAIRLDPMLAMAYSDLAKLLMTHADPSQRRPQEAQSHALKAVELTDGKDLASLIVLIKAYVANNRGQKAADTIQRAVALAEERGNRSAANQLRRLIIKSTSP
ncbi:MAG: HTTM domain-containing protein [Pirellulales bacterium]|nr:HTTM domain-containing protein [Pirellulales bacterium]